MHTIAGIFSDSKHAGKAVAELKSLGLGDDISVIAKDVNEEGLKSHQVSQNVTDGAVGGAAVGAALGALLGFVTGVASFALPGVGLVVLGPLATTLASAAAGAATGGAVGALIDWGIPEEKAKEFEHRIESGEVLVAVKVNPDQELEVLEVMKNHGVDTTNGLREGDYSGNIFYLNN